MGGMILAAVLDESCNWSILKILSGTTVNELRKFVFSSKMTSDERWDRPYDPAILKASSLPKCVTLGSNLSKRAAALLFYVSNDLS